MSSLLSRINGVEFARFQVGSMVRLPDGNVGCVVSSKKDGGDFWYKVRCNYYGALGIIVKMEECDLVKA